MLHNNQKPIVVFFTRYDALYAIKYKTLNHIYGPRLRFVQHKSTQARPSASQSH